jgi:hypothetical protein
MEPIHRQVLETACALADGKWTFSIAEVTRALPHLDPATVRTHVASRCCVNAPPNHQSRYRYFRSLSRGIYRVEHSVRRPRRARQRATWHDRLLAAMPGGVDPTLIAESLKITPTARLENMRRAAASIEAMGRR